MSTDLVAAVRNFTHVPPEGESNVSVEASRLDDHDRRATDSAGENYSYGPPPATPRSSNYVSDENLLAWLSEKQEGLYGELRDHMDMSRMRSKLIEDLARLKDRADKGALPEEILEEGTRLLQAYAGTEFETDLRALLDAELTELASLLESGSSLYAAAAILASDISAVIQSRIDALGRDDQLALIEIQSLTADIREAAQLASNLIASTSQSTNTIVGNIGR